MAPSLVKYALVDEFQGAWYLCVSVCAPHVLVTVYACMLVAVDLLVEVWNCCTHRVMIGALKNIQRIQNCCEV